jgi:hypothetical protein
MPAIPGGSPRCTDMLVRVKPLARRRAACGRSWLLRAKLPSVDLDAFNELATSLSGVRRTSAGGLSRWQYHGRLVARELDGTHVVVRVPFRGP